jgi:hypothetical protein
VLLLREAEFRFDRQPELLQIDRLGAQVALQGSLRAAQGWRQFRGGRAERLHVQADLR